MTVLVTGGLGFIGSKVVLQLLKKDIDVLVTDLDIVKNKDKLEIIDFVLSCRVLNRFSFPIIYPS